MITNCNVISGNIVLWILILRAIVYACGRQQIIMTHHRSKDWKPEKTNKNLSSQVFISSIIRKKLVGTTSNKDTRTFQVFYSNLKGNTCKVDIYEKYYQHGIKIKELVFDKFTKIQSGL